MKNTNLNLSKIYENYPKISENTLFLTDFIENYKNDDNKEIKETDENTIVMEIKSEKNRYNACQKLYISKKNLKPEKLEIIEKNNNTRVYILYNEIEINI